MQEEHVISLFTDDAICNRIDINKSRLVFGLDIKETPVITIIMPVYNHSDFLKESVLSAVRQDTEHPYEVIVIDNNHPEFQPINQEIIESIGSKHLKYYVNDENLRFTGNCNAGIALARSKYVMFCHDDDILMPDALSRVLGVKSNLNNKDDIAIFGNMIAIDEKGKVLPFYDEWNSWLFRKEQKSYPIQLIDFLQKNYTNGCGALYSRDRLLEIGGFSSNFSPCSDYALNVKYTARYGSIALRDYTFKYRITSQSDTGKVFSKMAGIHRIIKNEIINYLGLPACCEKYISIHEKVFNYHMYTQWSNDKQSKVRLLFYRIINKIINVCYFISRANR